MRFTIEKDELMKTMYELLEVSKNATVSDIKKAYRKMAVKHHPDKNPGDETAAAKFREIKAAYEIIADPEKRRMYNLALESENDFRLLQRLAATHAGNFETLCEFEVDVDLTKVTWGRHKFGDEFYKGRHGEAHFLTFLPFQIAEYCLYTAIGVDAQFTAETGYYVSSDTSSFPIDMGGKKSLVLLKYDNYFNKEKPTICWRIEVEMDWTTHIKGRKVQMM